MRRACFALVLSALVASSCSGRRVSKRAKAAASTAGAQPSGGSEVAPALSTGRPGSSAAVPTLPEPSSTKLAVSLDGKPFEIAGALITTSGGRGFELHLANLPITCDDVLRNGYSPRAGERRVSLQLGLVPARGGSAWHVVRVGHESFNNEGDFGPAIVDASDASRSKTVRLRLRARSEPRSFPGKDPPPTLHADGAIEAESCGVKRIHDAKPRPQTVRAKIGDLEIPIAGAIVDRHFDGTTVVWIQNTPIDCDSNVPFGDAAIRFFLDKEGAVDHVAFMGDSFLSQRTIGGLRISRDSKASVAFAAGAPQGEALAAIHATITDDGVPITVDGDVTALDCRQSQ